MKANLLKFAATALTLALVSLPSPFLSAAQTDITGPSGSGGFGTAVAVLPNGNIVVTDPLFDAAGPVADVGAVYLYSPSGTLISTLTGSVANDQVGSGGVTVLTNGNFVVKSPSWHNGAAASAGAATLVNGTTGLSAAVGAGNSLVGSTANDSVGTTVVALTNGNYVVISQNWDNGASTNAGAVTLGNGTTGVTGAVTSSNSLVGSSNNDIVGSGGLTELANGNIVILSPSWHSGAPAVGAATWSSGSTGVTGAVSNVNSLVGSTANDFNSSSIVKLTNGNYVVVCQNWDNGGSSNAGAVTWGNGLAGTAGVISNSTSIIGSTTNDQVGASVVALVNGNYVIASSSWDNGATANVGAATWCDGSAALVVGAVSASNSLVGVKSADNVGSGGIIALSNGNYVVSSPTWDNGALTNVGCVTWCNGTTGRTGSVTASNSLIGVTSSDNVGVGVVALTNGNFVVTSPAWDAWDNGATPNVGAATWCSGSTAAVGVVSSANSLVGSNSGDNVGSGGVTALPNGSYVVLSNNWMNGAIATAGAATWGNGTSGIAGPVSVLNSIIGSTSGDFSSASVLALTNGNYVLRTPGWDNGAVADVGAVTWGDGTIGTSGAIAAALSLIGSTVSDAVGNMGVVVLKNGNYIVNSANWNDGALVDVGAITFGNGSTGVKGAVSNANSLVGSTASDVLGTTAGTAATDGNYVALNSSWTNGANAGAGAATLINGTTGLTGTITAANSVVGSVAAAGNTMVTGYDTARQQMVVGRKASNIVTIFTPGAGSVSFEKSLYTVNESAASVTLTLVRSGGSNGACSVTLTTSDGTATAGSDYSAVLSQVVNFADRETTKTINVAIVNGAPVNEPNETFTAILTTPTNTTLGSIASTTVRIVDPGDIIPPTAPTVTSPAQGAAVNVNSGASLSITGSAVDNKGIGSVEVQLNGSAWTPATMSNGNSTKTDWVITMPMRTGLNTLLVRCTDTSGLVSPVTTRTFKVLRPLRVSVSGTGTVTSGFVPSSFREVGSSLTIVATPVTTPAPGTVFAGWTLVGTTVQQLGLTANALQKPTITFLFHEGMQLVANFVANPFTSTVVGTYKGIITADPVGPPVTLPDNSTEGLFSVTIQSNGGFTATMGIDGSTMTFVGAFDPQGVARFGTARSTEAVIARVNKPSLTVAFKIDGTVPFSLGTLSGTVTAKDYRGVATAVSKFTSERAFFDGTTNIVPAAYLNAANANGVFNVVFGALPTSSQPAGFQKSYYPQGHGFCTLTVAKNGIVTLSNGSLADGTRGFTATTTLSQALTCPLYIPLYSQKGFLSVRLKFDNTQTNTDVTAVSGTSALWQRPAQSTQHYAAGWPEVIKVNTFGAKFTVTNLYSDLLAADGPDANTTADALQAPDEDGNALLDFTDGKLEGPLTKAANISGADAVTKVPANDPTFALTVTRASGLFNGTFTHTDDSVLPYQGIIVQKGAFAGGYGYFLSVTPKPVDYSGEGGAVLLIGQP